MYRYILRESCSQFDSLPLTSLTIPLFAKLALSSRQDVDPAEWCRVFGVRDVNEQCDSEEFLNIFADKLESSLASTPHRDLLRELFGGTEVQQVIGIDPRSGKRFVREKVRNCSFVCSFFVVLLFAHGAEQENNEGALILRCSPFLLFFCLLILRCSFVCDSCAKRRAPSST